MELTLTTLNLQGFENWNDRSVNIIDFLSRTNPDIIFFQEAVYLPEISPYTQAEVLNKTMLYPYEQHDISRLQVGIEYPVYREGLSILSKHPIMKANTLALAKEDRDPHQRILQMADLLIGDKIVKIANIHLSVTDQYDLATPQLQEILSIMKSRGEQRILMGDFNLAYLEETAELWQDDYIASTHVPYLTYPTMNKRIEYALIPKSFEFKDVSVSDDSLSDHRALTVKIAEAALKPTSRTQSLVSLGSR